MTKHGLPLSLRILAAVALAGLAWALGRLALRAARRALRALPYLARHLRARTLDRGKFHVVETTKIPLIGLRGGEAVAQTLTVREEVRRASPDLAGLALALGHDPKSQRLEVVGGQWPALRVLEGGKPVRSYTFAALRRRGMRDPAFARAWEDCAEACS